MMTISPYLNFDGKTEEAMRFYAEALAAKIEIHRFGESPMPHSPAMKNRVMHARVWTDTLTLMASDTNDDHKLQPGNQVHLSLNFSSKDEQTRIWERLATGGNVTMPLTDAFFGRFGMLVDKFGIQWMLHQSDTPVAK